MAFITPKGHLLESIRVLGPTSLIGLLAEAFDNAFDADAHNIGVTVSDDAITIIDDGHGISKNKFLDLVTPGAHSPSPTTKLGIYGIGVKYHAIRWGDEFDADTTTVDGRRQLSLNWRDVQRRAQGGDWEILDPVEFAVRDVARIGTRITISALLRDIKQVEIVRALDQLALLFQPALADGRTITINGQRIVPPTDPSVTDVVDETIVLPSGRSVHVYGGLLVQKSKLRRVHVAYHHRVILADSIFAARDYPPQDMFARVRLHGSWRLAEFKDAIRDDEYEELEERVHNLLHAILEKCRTRNLSARTQEAGEWLNANLPEELTPVRPPKTGQKKKPGEKRHEGKGETRAIPRAKPADSGPVQDKRKNGLIIDLVSGEDIGVGKFLPGLKRQASRVQIAIDDPTIAAWMNLPGAQKELGFAAIKQIALMLYDDGIQPVRTDMFAYPVPGMENDGEDIGHRLSWLFGKQTHFAAVDEGAA